MIHVPAVSDATWS